MKISYDSTSNVWQCAEIYTNNPLPFDKYQWWIISDLEFDKNVVLVYSSIRDYDEPTNLIQNMQNGVYQMHKMQIIIYIQYIVGMKVTH